MSGKSFGKVDFVRCVPGGKRAVPIFKIAVRANGTLILFFNMAAIEIFGDDATHIEIACATVDGRGVMRVKHGGPSEHRLARIGKRAGGHSGGRAFIANHPFEPGVIHAGREVEAEIKDGVVTLVMPDWDEILGEALAAQEAESDE